MKKPVLLTILLLSTSLLCAHGLEKSDRVDEKQIMEKVAMLDVFAKLSAEEMIQRTDEIKDHIEHIIRVVQIKGALPRDAQKEIFERIGNYTKIEQEKLAALTGRKTSFTKQ